MIFEDEEDIFSGGSPKKKFFDIVYNANRNLVEKEIDQLVMRLCIVESMLEEKIGEEALEHEVKQQSMLPSEELEMCLSSKYIELTANILTQNE
jgi:DNA-binding transcriptional regulator GbsR (MarR family)